MFARTISAPLEYIKLVYQGQDELVRLGASKAPRSADDLPGFLEDLGFRVEVHQPKKPTDPCGLDIIVYTT